jgi:hypothetical protein
MSYNWLIAFVVLIVIVIFIAWIFWNAGCEVTIGRSGCGCGNIAGAGGCGCQHNRAVNAAVAGAMVNGAASGIAAGVAGANDPNWNSNNWAPGGDSVTDPFAPAPTPCNRVNANASQSDQGEIAW